MCKSYGFFIATFLLITTMVAPASNRLSVSLYMYKKETSRDSNWQKTWLTIENGTLRYKVKHGGRNPRKNSSTNYSLNRQQEAQLVDFIKEKNLNRNLKEIKTRKGYGISLILKFDLLYLGTKSSSHLEGRINIWGAQKHKSNLKNLAYYQDVRSLLLFLKRKLGFSEIEI